MKDGQEGKLNVHDGHRQRLRNRIATDDFERVNDHEFLEGMLYYAIPRKDTNELAHQILNEFGGFVNLLLASRKQLNQCKYISPSLAEKIIAKRKMLNRMNDSFDVPDLVRYKGDLITIFTPKLTNINFERLCVALIRENGTLIANVTLFEGEHIKINIQEIIDLALKTNANGVAIAYNHLDTDEKPSLEELSIAAKIKSILEDIKISLSEFVVFTRDRVYYCLDDMKDAFKHKNQATLNNKDNYDSNLNLEMLDYREMK